MIVLFDTLLEPGLLECKRGEAVEGEGEGVEKERQEVGEGDEENKDADEDRGSGGKVSVVLLTEIIICGLCFPLAR